MGNANRGSGAESVSSLASASRFARRSTWPCFHRTASQAAREATFQGHRANTCAYPLQWRCREWFEVACITIDVLVYARRDARHYYSLKTESPSAKEKSKPHTKGESTASVQASSRTTVCTLVYKCSRAWGGALDVSSSPVVIQARGRRTRLVLQNLFRHFFHCVAYPGKLVAPHVDAAVGALWGVVE